MQCLYLDHINSNEIRDLFQPILQTFEQNSQLIVPEGDLPPEEIDALTKAVNNKERIWAFVHTGRHENLWIKFAEEYKELVRLVLLSRNATQFGGRQGACAFPENSNVYGFAPASRHNLNLKTVLNNLQERRENRRNK